MYRYLIAGLFCLFIGQVYPQELIITKADAEVLFLEQNLSLLAKKLEISQEESKLIQAKVWPNPVFEISEVNLWKTTNIEEQPIIFNNWGASQQYAFRVEQLIETAGKRRKKIELQLHTIEQKQHEFELTLKELKLAFRNTVNTILFLQEQKNVYKEQIENTQRLISGYAKQLEAGNISRAQYIRLKAAELRFSKELINTTNELESGLKELKNFLNIASNTSIHLSDPLVTPTPKIGISDLYLEQWISHAQENRSEITLNKTIEKQLQKQLELEKSQRVPDLTLSVDYDRGGNIMRDFVGIGVSFDLPIFDRNKGNIKEAMVNIELAHVEAQAKQTEIANDIIEEFRNYDKLIRLYQEIDEGYEANLDQLLQAYSKNLQNKNISLLEYLDFVEAYIDNKLILLETKKDLNEHFENLQYAVGMDL